MYEGSEACERCQPVSGSGRTYCRNCGLTLGLAVRRAAALLRR